MRVSSSERYDPTAMTSVATPPPTTSEIASACDQSRFRSRSSLRSSARIASPCELSSGAPRLVQAFGREKAAPGFQVNAYAAGFDHCRWLYVLPNGDVPVAETDQPSGRGKSLRGLAMKAISTCTC